jgi:plasmid stabilization system protein ParE
VRRLLWDAKARKDLTAVTKYFSEKDPRIAALLLERIETTAAALAKRDTGRPGRMPRMREKSVVRTRYILAYRVLRRQIVILRVIHSAQEWTGKKWPKG